MSLATRNILIALLITGIITGTLIYAVNYLNNARISELNAVQHQLSIDSLSLETQFSLLETAPCDSLASSTILTSELTDLGSRLTYMENQLGTENPQVIQIKEQYSLLEIRDYLITKRLAAACKVKPITVLYFYSKKGDCADCDRANYALSYLRDQYPDLRVYSFDYNLDLGALKTLITVDKVGENLPAFIINGKYYSGFTSLEDFKKLFPKGTFGTSTPTTIK